MRDFSAKKKSDCMVVVENLLEDLRLHTHGFASQNIRGGNNSQQIRAIITRRSRKLEDFDQRYTGDRKSNLSNESHNAYYKSTSPDMLRRVGQNYSQFSYGLDQIDFSAQIIPK